MKLQVKQLLDLLRTEVGAGPGGLSKGAALRHLGQLTDDLNAMGLSEKVIVETGAVPSREFEEHLKGQSEPVAERAVAAARSRSRKGK
jgi:hypothetical protein